MSVLQKGDAGLPDDAGEIDVREFRAKRSNLPLYVLGAILVPVAVAAYFGGIDAWAGAIITVVSAPNLIALRLRKNKLRLLLGAPGYFVTDGSSKGVVLWEQVTSAVVVKDEGRIILRLSDGLPIHINYANYENADELREAVRTCLGNRIDVPEVRSDAAKTPAALLIVLLGITAIGFIVLASFGPKGAVLAAGVAVAVGAGVGAVLLGQTPPAARTRRFVRAFITVCVSGLALCALYTALMFLLHRRFYVRLFWSFAVLLLGYALGLVFVPLIVRTIHLHKHVQQTIRGQVPDPRVDSGDDA